MTNEALSHWCLTRNSALVIVLLLGCSQVRRLSPADRLTPDEKLDYLVLSSISADAGRQFLSTAGPAARTEFLDWFWQDRRDSLPARETYESRARQARSFFGRIDLLNDDRVKTYIRFGPPHRESYEPEPVRSDTLVMLVNPAEIWTYDSAGFQFDFVKTGTAYKQVGESWFGPSVLYPSLEEVDLGRPVPAPRADASSAGLALSLSRMGQFSDTVAVEVAYGIGLPARLTVQELYHVAIIAAGRRTGSRVSTGLWTAVTNPDEVPGATLAVGRQVFDLAADVYDVTVTAVSADGARYSTVARTLNLVDYIRRIQPSSDLAFYFLADSTFQAPQFEGRGWRRLVPLVTDEVVPGQSFYAAFELYNLDTDQGGRHRVEADYDIIEQQTNQLAVVPTPTRFKTGDGPTAVVVERVHTMDLRPGSYLLVARCKDLESGREVSVTGQFRIR